MNEKQQYAFHAKTQRGKDAKKNFSQRRGGGCPKSYNPVGRGGFQDLIAIKNHDFEIPKQSAALDGMTSTTFLTFFDSPLKIYSKNY